MENPEDYSKRKYLSFNEAKEKVASYCAYQERTQKEVRQKLWDLGVYGDDAEEIISQMITENFINEERFAIAYAGGKFRIKKWGKIKIKEGLKQKGVSPYCLQKGLDSIEYEEYICSLQTLLENKLRTSKVENLFIRNQKVATYAISRGFESQIVWETLQELTS